MTKSNLKHTESEVLRVYQEVNPSTHKIENSDIFKDHKNFRETLFRDRLKFPLKMFKDARILDFGSGTGEQCIFYAEWGAKLTCVEINNLAVKRLKELFFQFNLGENLEKVCNCSLFEFNEKEKEFDIVISDGVLHHTEDAELGFKKLVANLASKGYVIISIGNSAGGFQRNLQRAILYKLSNNNKEEIVRLAKILFNEHLERSVKFGRRTVDAVIFDTYINPKTDNVPVSEVLRWFSENGINFYSSWPPLQFPFSLVDSANYYNTINLEDREYRGLVSFSELFWMSANKHDEEVIDRNKSDLLLNGNIHKLTKIIEDITPESIKNLNLDDFINKLKLFNIDSINKVYQREMANIPLFFSEVIDCVTSLNIGDDIYALKRRIDGYKVLFRGYSGLGDSYFVGYKK